MKDEGKRDLIPRTRNFALSVIKLYSMLPKRTEAQILGRQLLRSGTSVGAQYRGGQRAKSVADLVSKVEGALQELDETSYWLELLVESKLMQATVIMPLQVEAQELTAILVTIVKSVKSKKSR
jgi:four helix bundle protein